MSVIQHNTVFTARHVGISLVLFWAVGCGGLATTATTPSGTQDPNSIPSSEDPNQPSATPPISWPAGRMTCTVDSASGDVPQLHLTYQVDSGNPNAPKTRTAFMTWADTFGSAPGANAEVAYDLTDPNTLVDADLAKVTVRDSSNFGWEVTGNPNLTATVKSVTAAAQFQRTYTSTDCQFEPASSIWP